MTVPAAATGDVVAGVRLRHAVRSDDEVLLRLERACGLEALGHVFPPDEFPYPDGQVRDRWRRRLSDPAATTLVAVDARTAAPVGFVCVRSGVVEHLGVHPSRQRQGVGRRLLTTAVQMAQVGGDDVSLWCLAENDRALRFYAGLGWAETGELRTAEFAPYPVERRLAIPAADAC